MTFHDDHEPMDQSLFEEMLDRHGTDLTKWPTRYAASAQTLLQVSAAARAALASALSISTHLHELRRRHHAPGHLANKILGRTQRIDPLDRLLHSLYRYRWRAALIAVTPIIAGFYLGLTMSTEPDPANVNDNAIAIATLAFVDIYAEDNHAQDNHVELP